MNDNGVNEMSKRLRAVLEPMKDAGLKRDLWPDVLRKMDQRGARVPWFDWVLMAGLGAAVLLFPRLLPALLYHL